MDLLKDIFYTLGGTKEMPTVKREFYIDEAIEWLAQNIRDCRAGEEFRFVSGEANYKFWNHRKVADALYRAIDHCKVKVSCVVGPVISVSKGDKNVLLELALDEKIDLYLAPKRVSEHYRIFGERLLWYEDYHTMLQERFRTGVFIFQNADPKHEIQKHIEQFERMIHDLRDNRVFAPDQVYTLTNFEIDLLNDHLAERGLRFDDLGMDEIKINVEEAKKRRVNEFLEEKSFEIDDAHIKVLEDVTRYKSLNFVELISATNYDALRLKDVLYDLEKENLIRLINKGQTEKEIVVAGEKGYILAH